MHKKLNPHSHEMNIQKSVHFCDHPMMCQNVYDTRAQVFSTIQTFVLLGQSRQGLDWIVRPGYSSVGYILGENRKKQLTFEMGEGGEEGINTNVTHAESQLTF